MSKENAKKFYEALKSDKSLAEELQNALKAQKIESEEQATQALVAFAENKGFAFTAAELVELETESRELSDDELDQVNAAGGCFVGGGGNGGTCVVVGRYQEKVKCVFFGGWD